MGYKVLITIDLPQSVDSKKRNKFYSVLKTRKWVKIPGLTTAWRISYQDDWDRKEVIKDIKADLAEAKIESQVRTVRYALQIGIGPVVINTDTKIVKKAGKYSLKKAGD